MKNTAYFAAAGAVLAVFCAGTMERNALWTDAVQLRLDMVRKSPKKARVYGALAEIYQSRHAYEPALQNLDRLLLIEPANAGAYSNRGNVLLDMGRPVEALADFNKALTLRPALAAAYVGRGTILYQQGKIDAALEDFHRAAAIDPNLAEAYYNSGNAYARKGAYDKAVQEYSRAISRDPYLREAYDNRGNSYLRLGLTDLAERDHRRAEDLAAAARQNSVPAPEEP